MTKMNHLPKLPVRVATIQRIAALRGVRYEEADIRRILSIDPLPPEARRVIKVLLRKLEATAPRTPYRSRPKKDKN